MKTHVHQYDIPHAGEIPRKEDVSVANLKKINSLKQQVRFNGMARYNGKGVGCRCLVIKAQNVQECITMLVPTC